MILFETTTNVFEILWDIALAVFILQISFIYYIVVFLSSCLLNFLRGRDVLLYLFSSFQLSPSAHDLDVAEITGIALLTTLCARVVIVRFQIPRNLSFRLVVGAVALAFMMGSDLVLGVVAYEEGWDAWRFDRPRAVLGSVLGLMALFALMPTMWLVIEGTGEWEGEKVHKHDGKGVADAVPTVSVIEKKEGSGKKE